ERRAEQDKRGRFRSRSDRGCGSDVEDQSPPLYRIVPRNVDTNFIGADQLQAEMGVALECRGNRQEARCRRRVDAHALDGLAGEQEIEAVDRIRPRRADSTAEAVGEARSAWQQIGDD